VERGKRQDIMMLERLKHEDLQMGQTWFTEAKKSQNSLLAKGSVGEAYQAAMTNADKIKDIIDHPEKYNTPIGSVEVVDTFVRTFNGNNAIRLGQLAQMGINRNLEDRIQSFAQQYSATGLPTGGKFSVREIKAMAQAVAKIGPQLKPAFQKAAIESMRDLSSYGNPHPELAVPDALRAGLFPHQIGDIIKGSDGASYRVTGYNEDAPDDPNVERVSP
jgi:hypothetical protein